MYDVIIAGAGPAGSTCARECAKQGLKTLVVDKDDFPRQKPCGGAVSEMTFSYLDFPVPPEVIGKECFGARIFYHGRKGRSIEIHKKARMAALVIREAFDAFLLAKAVEAGAHFSPREQAREVKAGNGFVDVITDKAAYRAAYAVGADGVHSRIALALRPPFRKDEMMLALVSRVKTENREIDGRLSGDLEMHFGVAPMGYGWVFPHDGHYSVGVGALASAFAQPRETLLNFASSLGFELSEVRGHFIPYGGIRRKIASGRVLLAGDAAGFGDPFTGEGISHAVLSGKLAARAVVDSLKNVKTAAGTLAWYQDECDRLIIRNLRAALRLAELIDRFPDVLIRIFFDNRKALDRYLDIPGGGVDYVRFMKWLVPRSPYFLLASYLRSGSISRTSGP